MRYRKLNVQLAGESSFTSLLCHPPSSLAPSSPTSPQASTPPPYPKLSTTLAPNPCAAAGVAHATNSPRPATLPAAPAVPAVHQAKASSLWLPTFVRTMAMRSGVLLLVRRISMGIVITLTLRREVRCLGIIRWLILRRLVAQAVRVQILRSVLVCRGVERALQKIRNGESNKGS